MQLTNGKTVRHNKYYQPSLRAQHIQQTTTSSTPKNTDTMILPGRQLPCYFKLLGECDRPTSHDGARSLQLCDAFFKVKLTHSLFYLQLF